MCFLCVRLGSLPGCRDLLGLYTHKLFVTGSKVDAGVSMFARLCNSRLRHSCLFFPKTICSVEFERNASPTSLKLLFGQVNSRIFFGYCVNLIKLMRLGSPNRIHVVESNLESKFDRRISSIRYKSLKSETTISNSIYNRYIFY